jgi:calreticulin
MKFLLASLSFSAVFGTVYFKETFDNGLSDKWVLSTSKDDYGKFVVSAGKFFADESSSKGLQTSEDAKFYAISVPFDKEFDNAGKTMVIQFSVKHEQGIDCGGGYVKILPPGLDLEKLTGDSKYNIMFGPDICGMDKKTHVIFSYKDKNHLVKRQVTAESDQLTRKFGIFKK